MFSGVQMKLISWSLSNLTKVPDRCFPLASEGPLIFISNRSLKELFPRDVCVALFTMFMWLNPLSKIAVLIECHHDLKET